MVDKRQRSVRKRPSAGVGSLLLSPHRRPGTTVEGGGAVGLPSSSMSLSYLPSSPSSRGRHVSPLQRIRNVISTILVMSLPVGIFLVPYLLSSSSNGNYGNYGNGNRSNPIDRPRIVVTMSTEPDRLPFLRPVLESILIGQTVPPDVVYLIIPRTDYYSKEEYDVERPWPEYLHEMLEGSTATTTAAAVRVSLEVLEPEFAYGPLTGLLYALEKEEEQSGVVETSDAEADEDAETTDDEITEETAIPGTKRKLTSLLGDQEQQSTTRIVVVSDTAVYRNDMIQFLIDGSINHPNHLVALSGAQLRNDFRQVRWYESPEYDKFPNLYVTTASGTNDHGEPAIPLNVDLVVASTGLCLPTTVMHGGSQRLRQLLIQDEALPHAAMEADGIFLSALMELWNVTKTVVPGGTGPPTPNPFVWNSTTDATVAMSWETMTMMPTMEQWMEATHYFQQKWNIWTKYHLLDIKNFTQTERDFLRCEATKLPDCTSRSDLCLPNLDCKGGDHLVLLGTARQPSGLRLRAGGT